MPGFKIYCFYENRNMKMGFAVTCSSHLCFLKHTSTNLFCTHFMHIYDLLSVAVSTATAIVSMMKAPHNMKNSSWLVLKWWILSIFYCCMVTCYVT
jgi:hypothetical protein